MILGIYGESNSGKTNLVERLIKALRKKGYKVGSVKHIREKDFTIDTEGKDTWRHSKAGAELVVAHAKDEATFIVNKNLAPKDVADIIDKIAELDMVIVEGFWDDDNPKIAVGDIEERPNTVLRYENNFDEVLDYAVEEIEVEKVLNELPGLDCGKCGMGQCIELARAIHTNKKGFDDCHYFSEKKVLLEVDGEEIPLGGFAKDIVSGTIAGMVRSLKGVEKGRNIRVEISANED